MFSNNTFRSVTQSSNWRLDLMSQKNKLHRQI